MTFLRPLAAVLCAALPTFALHAQTAVTTRPSKTAVAPPAPSASASTPAACEKQAGQRTGDARKAFLQACLKQAAASGTPQDRMRACNVASRGKKGDERRAFMSECLRKKPG